MTDMKEKKKKGPGVVVGLICIVAILAAVAVAAVILVNNYKKTQTALADQSSRIITLEEEKEKLENVIEEAKETTGGAMAIYLSGNEALVSLNSFIEEGEELVAGTDTEALALTSSFDYELIENNLDNITQLTAQFMTLTEQIVATQSEWESIVSENEPESESEWKDFYQTVFGNSVVLGDSIMSGFSLYGWLSEDQVYAAVSASIKNAADNFTSAAAALPENAFFSYGMNDMGNYSKDAEAFTADYAKLIEQFHEASPDTKLYVLSISTPTQAAIANKSWLGNYEKFNEALSEMCASFDFDVMFISVNYILETNTALYNSDGIHAGAAYYPYLLDLMFSAMID